jgi:ABC-type Zn2+ transport system substrate-binding protein/surface adhesin
LQIHANDEGPDLENFFLKVLETLKWCSKVYIIRKNYLMGNEVKPNKQKNNKNDDHNGAHNVTTTHHLQADG